MRLQSAHDLKAELVHDLVVERRPIPGARSLAVGMRRGPRERSVLAVGAREIATVPDMQRTLALGVARHGKQYRLAVRLQRPSLADSALLEHIRQRSAGEVDVRQVGRIDKRAGARVPWYQRNTRPLLIGASVGHFEVTAGTLGAFVERGGEVAILSNNHVLANEDRGRRGDWVLQRAPFDGGRQPGERIARLSRWVRLKPRQPNQVDAAMAALEDGVEYYDTRLKGLVRGKERLLAGVAADPVDEGRVVYKVGRTTGPTRGRITAFALDNVVVNFDVGNLRFDDQIEIEGSGSAGFSDGGDSGSLIVNDAMEAVGLLFAGSEYGGRNGRGMTYANPIRAVLGKLGARLSC